MSAKQESLLDVEVLVFQSDADSESTIGSTRRKCETINTKQKHGDSAKCSYYNRKNLKRMTFVLKTLRSNCSQQTTDSVLEMKLFINVVIRYSATNLKTFHPVQL